jgi:telomerase reverse transcriptase
LQKLGIPQGLNVSGVLCSLYFAYLEQQYVKVKNGLLMRLTDDYFYIGPEQEAVDVLNSLLECASANNFSFSEDKISKNF